jgi:hypothetical protein
MKLKLLTLLLGTLCCVSAFCQSKIPLDRLHQSGATMGQIIQWNGTAWVPFSPASITAQSANKVYAGPTSGSAALPTWRGLVLADLPPIALANLSNVSLTSLASGDILKWNGSNWVNFTPNYLTAAVTSVGLSLPSIFNVSGSPVTSTGTLAATLATQTANFGFFGPTTGSAAAPTFRAMVLADLPAIALGNLSNVSAGSPTSGDFLKWNGSAWINFTPTFGTGSVTSISSGAGISLSPTTITTSGTVSVDQSFSPTWSSFHQFSFAPTFSTPFTLSLTKDPFAIGSDAMMELGSDSFSGSSFGTYFGIRAPSGTSKNFFDFQVAGASKMSGSPAGLLTAQNLTLGALSSAGLVKNSSGGVISGGNQANLASDVTGTLPAANLPNAGVFTGDATTTFPALTIGAGAITATKIATATITDVQVAAANKDGAAGTASMRTLGTGSTQAAAGNHTHAAADVTSGTFGTARGGTGLSSIGTANQILGVNAAASGLEYKSVTAGSTKLTVTHSAGGIALDVADAGASQKGAIQLAGDLTGTASSPALANVVTGGTVGGATSIPVLTYDSKGRITSVSTATPTGTASAAGSSGQVQFNGGSGTLAADSGMVYTTPGQLALTATSTSATGYQFTAPASYQGIFFNGLDSTGAPNFQVAQIASGSSIGMILGRGGASGSWRTGIVGYPTSGAIIGTYNAGTYNSSAFTSSGLTPFIATESQALGSLGTKWQVRLTPNGTASTVTYVEVGEGGDVVLNARGSALATSATKGQWFPPSMAGVPTAAPTNSYTGAAAGHVTNSTDHVDMAYDGANWSSILRGKVTVASATYVMLPTDDVVLIGGTGVETITAVAASLCKGRIMTILCTRTTGAITLLPAGSETFNGTGAWAAASVSINNQGGCVTYTSDGSNYYILSKN